MEDWLLKHLIYLDTYNKIIHLAHLVEHKFWVLRVIGSTPIMWFLVSILWGISLLVRADCMSIY